MYNYVVEISDGKTNRFCLHDVLTLPNLKGILIVPAECVEQAEKTFKDKNSIVVLPRVLLDGVDSIIDQIVTLGKTDKVKTLYLTSEDSEALVVRLTKWDKIENVVCVVGSRGKQLKSYLNAVMHSTGRLEVIEVSK